MTRALLLLAGLRSGLRSLAPLAALGLVACPLDPTAVDTDTAPSSSGTGTGVAATTSGVMTGGAVTEVTTGTEPGTTGVGGESSSSGLAGSTTDGALSSSGGGGSTTGGALSSSGVDGSTSGGSTTGGDGSTTLPMDLCGDGVLDPGEGCDDGNKLSGDGCLPGCTPGVGVALGPLDLPPFDPSGYPVCLTLLGRAVLDPPTLGLVLGGPLSYFGPEGQTAAHIESCPLPAAAPLVWSWSEYAGPHDRRIGRLSTAENGDVLAAGTVYTDPQDLSGFLWLARFTPAGELVWLRDHESIPSRPNDLAASPSGDIIVVGQFAGWVQKPKGAWVHAFDADGALVWEYAAPTDDEWRLLYEGVTVATDGSVHATGRGGPADLSFQHVVVESFSADGAPLWQVELNSPKFKSGLPSDIVVTTQGALVVAIQQGNNSQVGDQTALVALDSEGGLLWWEDNPPPELFYEGAGPLVAAPDGGVFVAWTRFNGEDFPQAQVARHGATGETLWSINYAGEPAKDAAFGADNLLYLLQGDQVRRYEP
jgi:cysteine-rich repeat protein